MANPICRMCASPLSKALLVLPMQPLTDDFVKQSEPEKKEYLEDIQIFECTQCGLVQNPRDFDHEGYYEDYQYSTAHSSFVQNFMHKYAEASCQIFAQKNGRSAISVIEIGSGDGEQLKHFLKLGIKKVMGVEPSKFLGLIAEKAEIPTRIELFEMSSIAKIRERFDICISSYTFDHVRNPREYLEAARALLSTGGLLVFEVHNLRQILQKSEYCLLEHEHTIYMDERQAVKMVEECGYEVLCIDPLPIEEVRGNSMIVVAHKVSAESVLKERYVPDFFKVQLDLLNANIQYSIACIERWIESVPLNQRIVGFGAGGRGVMTLAALRNSGRFSALFDSNFESSKYLAPKTRIPIVGKLEWSDYKDSYCLVFSYGYMEEIKAALIAKGFDAKNILSLLEVNRE